MGHRSIDAQFKEFRDMLLPLARGFADFDNHVKTLSEAVCMVTSRIASVEQTVNALSAKMVMLQRWSRILITSLHVRARSRHMQPQHQRYAVRHDPGPQWNRLTAPQPQGPMAQDHLMTTGTHDEDLILPQAPRMNNHGVPSYDASLANSTSKGLQSGSTPFGNNPTCWRVTNLSEFIAKQVPCQSGLFLKHEANAKTLLLDIKMMVFRMQPTVPSAVPVVLSQCVKSRSVEDREIGKQIVPLWRELAEQLKNSLS